MEALLMQHLGIRPHVPPARMEALLMRTPPSPGTGVWSSSDDHPGHLISPHRRMYEDQRHLLDDHDEFMEQLMPPRDHQTRQDRCDYFILRYVPGDTNTSETPPTVNELYLHLHTVNHDGVTFIDTRSERFYDKLQRIRLELTQATPDQPVDDEAVYLNVVGECPKGRVYGLGSLGRKKRRYAYPGASTSQMPEMVPRASSISFRAITKGYGVYASAIRDDHGRSRPISATTTTS
ncbi:hypothetical protein Scep_014170 [Stephania cephalantha]|uniref:Uncharacterized protein n=1 Tax=Stephania cephalantha TaxID=152367 RepID=A0AAP0J0S4_9MAGN